MLMNILFTICGRAGSKGFKNKNLKEMNGVPLVYYTLAVIKAYTEIHFEDNIYIAVNTDSSELVKLIKKHNNIENITFVDRKSEHAGDSVPKVDVIKDTYAFMKSLTSFDAIIDLDITSPLRIVRDIENIITEFTSGKKYDVVFSVVKARRSPYFNMVEKKNSGYYGKICNSDFTARQQAPQSFELNASIYAYSPDFLNSDINKTILDYNCGIVEMQDYLVLDIDSEEDFEMMQILHKYYCGTDCELGKIYDSAMKLYLRDETFNNIQ